MHTHYQQLCLRLTFEEHWKLKSSKYLRTFSLSPKIRRSYKKKWAFRQTFQPGPTDLLPGQTFQLFREKKSWQSRDELFGSRSLSTSKTTNSNYSASEIYRPVRQPISLSNCFQDYSRFLLSQPRAYWSGTLNGLRFQTWKTCQIIEFYKFTI